jgi:hypothetical protein
MDAASTGSDGGDSGANADAAPDVSTQPPSGPVAVSATAATSMSTEVQIAVAPDGTIAIAWIDIGNSLASTSPIAYRFSTNGGSTFTPTATVTIPSTLAGSDPALTVDAAGNFYLALLGVHFTTTGTADYTRVYVTTAKKGTNTFGQAVEITNPTTLSFYDHPKILATASGTVVVSVSDYASDTATTGIGIAATSTDGQTWQLNSIVDQAAAVYPAYFWLCEGAGILYTTYLEFSGTSEYVALRSSTNNGTTWSSASTVVSLANEIPAALDPSCVASGGETWVEYATNDTPQTDPTSFLDSAQTIRVAHLTNNGGSLDSARADALDTAAATLGLLPVLVREPGGAMDVAYLSGNAEGDTQGTMRYARTAGMGSPFGSSALIDRPLLFTLNRTKRTWLGDYLGAVYGSGRLLVAYPMNANGTTHVWFRSMPLP